MTNQITQTSPSANTPTALAIASQAKRPRRMAREPQLESSSPAPMMSKPDPRAPQPRGASKSDAVIALLSRDEGATSAELIAVTDWLPHTMRAALTGLRKKGHTIERSKRGDKTCYRIVKVG